MGSSCSSGQAHKDKDSVSTRSEESPSYQATCKKPSQGSLGNHSGQHSGIILEASTVQQQHLRTNNGTKNASGDVVSPSAVRVDRKPLAPKVMRDIATSSASCDSVSLSSPPGTSAESPKDWPQLPPQLQQLPESTQNLLLGRVAAAKTNSRTNKIIIYVCAADSQDCCCEKRALHVTVAPALRESCRRRGYELHVVDLHWRTGLEKQQDHEFPELCLGELARQSSCAYVVPVLFLSNSLGTPLLPATVESSDFEAALKAAGSGDDGLLRARYALDEHAQPPCFRLRPISQAPGFKETSVEEKEAALREWQSEIERTLAVMVEVFPQELRDTYLTTVVEQEVHNTVCMSQELARRCIWVYRVFTQAGQSEAATPSNGQSQAGEAELKRRLDTLHNDLKTQLSEKHILRVPVPWGGGVIDAALPEHAQYLATVTQQLSTQLSAVIDGIIEDHDKVIVRSSRGVEASLLDELTEQARFSQRAAQCSIDREDMLQQIKTYLLDTRQTTLVLAGPHGSGRTTLLAKLAQCCHLWLPEASLLLRHVNVSAGSATVEQLLCSLANQASVLSTGGHVWGKHSVETYAELLPSLLAEGGKQRMQIVIIDGLDQVKDFGAQTLSWLPRDIPANVKVIVSIADDTDLFAQNSADIGNGRILLQMPSLGKAEADAVLMASVMQYSHSVDASVQGCVRASVQDCTLPLYVKVLAWQTSWWSNSDREMKPLGDISNQVQQMLEELEALLDADKVALALALSTAAKSGVTDSEMIDLLAHEPEFHSSYTAVPWAPACLFWARLQKHLAPFVRWSAANGASTVRWLDAALESATRRRYLGTDAQHRRASASLASYFAGDWVTENQPTMIGRLISQPNKTEESYNRRKLDELPFATFQLTGSLKERFLLDHSWLYDKLCGSHVFQVLEDLALESRSSSNADLRMLTEFLSGHAAALAHDGRQFYGQLHQFLATAPSNITSCPLGARLSAVCACPPVPSLAPLPPRVGAEEAGTGSGFDAVVALPAAGFVATVATEREEVCVWSVADCRKVRTLKGVTQPICLQPVDPFRAVVLCGRELQVLNLEEGRVEVKLKGVMNQKMAFFGLHDANHLVALSRNRMYVNLLDLRTGDCVTTFKVGEDRFLNSLLVSGDGRVLVCGDETQKPFPLLVWNLSSRKLLYDLRIPHHDFVTSLAAITHEGHFVCCVATEVDEPGANFIVVYDLQSGTLFKKWKPGVDTVSLAISSRDACVVSGLADARILVWDLVTGNCRHTLRGHSAPVTFLRLDPGGGTLLSTDSQGRDRTLRLWDLNNGSLISVYTPPSAVPCCELVPGGHHVVLGSAELTTLTLLGGQGGGQGEVAAAFGNPERDAGSFDLAESR